MGLDTYAAKSPGRELSFWDRRAFRNAGVELAGGMHSGTPGSFRGKLYDDLVRHVTGVSLYQVWIPPEIVQRMSETFDRCDLEQAVRDVDAVYEHTPEEVLELRDFFRVCARRRLGLVGWW
jgi:hypothetical protein